MRRVAEARDYPGHSLAALDTDVDGRARYVCECERRGAWERARTGKFWKGTAEEVATRCWRAHAVWSTRADDRLPRRVAGARAELADLEARLERRMLASCGDPGDEHRDPPPSPPVADIDDLLADVPAVSADVFHFIALADGMRSCCPECALEACGEDGS